MLKSNRSKACDISQDTKRKVYERDKGLCVICGKAGIPNAHFIPRSKGGLGVEQNIVTLCASCHERTDHSSDRKMMLKIIEMHLKSKYNNWSKDKLVYTKYGEDYELHI